MVDVPAFIWVLTLAGITGLTGMTSFVLYRGAKLAGATRRSAVGLGAATAAVLGAWFTATGVIAAHDGYLSGHGHISFLPFAFAGSLIAFLAATRIPLVSRALHAPGMLHRLEWPHAFRVVGVVFLIMMALGRLPALFALPAGLGDIATGIAAPFVARRLARGTGHRLAVRFNLFGMLDLVTALTLALLMGAHVINVTPSARAITEAPIALIPTAAVPLLLTLHITSLRRLRAIKRGRKGTAGTTTPNADVAVPHPVPSASHNN
ncbi:hypothetical protein [Streptomyces liangshanensis]|uniref:Uncharacterized protein n=1 Tax=Streptomyces liangshanensis TaxID=2717324 RepID=A0A6G9H681_9ACTN|nr:hypothetical protein [Streptomyces liangshanensis]QIQ06043.1 hypothetical protein HA039_30380 [Streptomyces liangshanensis]